MEQEVREILGHAAFDPELQPAPLGSRIAQLFAGLGFTGEIPEFRGEAAHPPDFPE